MREVGRIFVTLAELSLCSRVSLDCGALPVRLVPGSDGALLSLLAVPGEEIAEGVCGADGNPKRLRS